MRSQIPGQQTARRRFRPTLETLEDRLAPATLPTGFDEAAVATGLSAATAMEIAPEGRLWVLEQAGSVKVFHSGSTAGFTALTIPGANIDSGGERGLLGIAFDPSYNVADAAPDYVYLYYTSTAGAGTHNRISRFTVDNTNPDQPTLGSQLVIFELDALSSATNHNGGAIHFGPDGKLYAAVGDNANSANSPSLTSLFGKILRINADGTIPTDNPFFNRTTGNDRAIWARGLRNPFTFTFQPGTGRMHINDVGQNTWEEINVGAAGANYGWAATEGDFKQSQFPNLTRPLYTYSHGSGAFQGFAITGGAFYNPSSPGANTFPASFTGDYFFADFVNNWIHVRDSATGSVSSFATGALGPVDLHVGNDGSLYYLARNQNRVVRVIFTDNQPPTITQEPANKSVSEGGSANFVVSASSTLPVTYQWQRAENGSNTFTDIPGATFFTYTLNNVQDSDNGAQFRVVVTNAIDSVTSDPATLTVTPPFQVKINFQDGSSSAFPNYLADTGLPFGDRGNGFSYGWNANNTASARNRNAPASPDERYDTFINMQLVSNPVPVWNLAVPNGSYTVHIVAGDPTRTDSIYRINVEGVLAINATPTAAKHWFERTLVVTVNDGRLTINNAAGAKYNKIDYIEVTATTPAQAFQQGSGANGNVAIEAEHFDLNVSQGNKSWTNYTAAGFSGSGALRATPDTGVNNVANYDVLSPRLDYRVNFVKTGIHYVWIRGIGPNSGSDSVHVGLDGQELASADRITGFGTNYSWTRATADGVIAKINVTSVGIHTLNLWMGEDGMIVDTILLTINPNFQPGTVAESARGN